MAVKRTADLIPFCHPLPLDSIKFAMHLEPATADGSRVLHIECRVKVVHKTGPRSPHS